MRIIVCIKQVPDTTEVKIDPKTGRMIREGIPSIMNPDDKHALEEGLKLKDIKNAKITVLSMGPPQAEDVLREALAMGADEAILLTDNAFAGADTIATSYALGTAIKKIGNYDLVLCGRQAIDGDTAQIGPQIAEFLELPQITYVRKLELDDGKIVAERSLENGYEVIETKLPALLTITKEANTPRYPTLQGIASAYREKKIILWNAKTINADEERLGLKGSPTWVKKSFAPQPKGQGVMLRGEPKQIVKELIGKLKEKNLIKSF